jgi:hypothetical protein
MALTADNLVISAADYKVILTLNNGLSTVLLTLKTIAMNAERESETIHAIGQQEPIAIKRNNAKFSGTLDLQVGEFATMLKAAGLVEGTSIEGATLAVTSLNPLGIQRVYGGLNINSEGIDIKEKSKDSVVSLKWEALAVKGISL